MVTFTKLLDTNDVYNGAVASVQKYKPATTPLSSDWAKYVVATKKLLGNDLKVFEHEEQAYVTWALEKTKNNKNMAAESLTIAKKLGQEWLQKEHDRLVTIKGLVDKNITEIGAARKELAKHQGFRGNIGFKSIAGIPDELVEYEEEFLRKRKAYIDLLKGIEPKVMKATVEYGARIDSAIALATSIQKDRGRKLELIDKELDQIEKSLEVWEDQDSTAYGEIDRKKTVIENGITTIEKGKNINADTFKASRMQLPGLENEIKKTNAVLNTVHKKFEVAYGMLKHYETAGDRGKKVDSMAKRFSKCKAALKDMQSTLPKFYEEKLRKLEKKFKF